MDAQPDPASGGSSLPPDRMRRPPEGDGLLAALNPEQRRAAEAVTGPVRILAGAGTGKTRTITHRIAHQVASGVARTDQVLAVTFTDRAAAELRTRLAGLGIPGEIRAATFHAAAWAQLRHFWHRFEAGPLPTVLSSKVPLLVPAARRYRVEARDLASEIEWAKARRLDPDAYAHAAASRDAPLAAAQMVEVYANYERAKRERDAIDYEDMLLRMTALLAEQPDVAAEVRDRYRFFTVDEFQDVNPAQWALLEAWIGDGDELCVVGDDDQTIFSFTGASAEYLLRFDRRFPHARTVVLTQSYRSTPQVLALANRVLRSGQAARAKQLRTELGDGPPPRFAVFDDAPAEAAAVAKAIGALLADGVRAAEIAVCYRINALSETYGDALAAAGIPYAVRGDAGFYDRDEIRQALAALRAAATAPPQPDPLAPAGELAHGPATVATAEAVLRTRLSWRPKEEPRGEAARERWQNLGALLGTITELCSEQPDRPLAEVVDELTERAAAGHALPGGRAGGAVTLMSLHRAKGTEFDAVFLVAVEEGLLPISYARDDDAAVAEERRLLYVGVTRARRHLWVSWALTRPGWAGKVQRRRPSRFLYALGEGAPQPPAPKPARERRTSLLASAGGDVDAGLVERLREWRAARAREDAVPAYVIFPDTTLLALASTRPATHRQLLAVPGFGPKRAERYGEGALAVIAGADPPPAASG